MAERTRGVRVRASVAIFGDEGGSPSLPEVIQQHLGTVLAQAYASMPDQPWTDSARFGSLLARLEAALVAQAGRDEATFHRELIGTMPSLHRFAMSLAKNPSKAEDLVQDTLMRAWRSRSRFQIDTNLSAWLFTIMRNVFYSDVRKSKPEVPDIDGEIANRVATIPEQSGRMDLRDVETALFQIPAQMREALVLVAIENLSYDQAAVIMKCQVGTVKSRVWRARDLLQTILKRERGETLSEQLITAVVTKSSGQTVV